MKESFKGLCNLNEDELKALLENSKTSIVIDTEVLLMLFQMEEKNSSELLDILESKWLSDKLWMPHDVGFSFMCNVNSYIVRERRLINEARKQLENFHDNVINMKSNPYLKDDVLANFKDTFDKIKTSFDSDINALDLELEKNTKKERIDKIFTKDKVGVNYTDAQLSELFRRGGERYGKEMPPSIDNGSTSERERYRDYIIWKEMQGFASYYKRNIVMVRGSKTKDWFNMDDNNRILGPNPSIVSEFAIKTKEISGIAADFYCLDLVSFLEKCHKFQFLKQPSDSLVSQLNDMIVVANSDKNAVSSQNRVFSTNSRNVGNIGEVKK